VYQPNLGKIRFSPTCEGKANQRVRNRFDVVIVGARCAGASLATLLARHGVDVAVVEKATFPRDTLSTHVFEADALAFLARLELTEQLLETRAPPINRADNRLDDLRWTAPWPTLPGDAGGAMSIRRFVLDPILARAAEQAGAEVRMATRVTGLVEDGGRVVGVRVDGEAGEEELRARLVVGADGRSSTIARLAGARRYNVVPSERALYWCFFEDAQIGEPTFVFHRWGDRMIQACPTDGGLYQVGVFVERADLDRFRSDLEAHFMDHAHSCEAVATAVADARPVGKLQGMVRWEGFFRDASGSGWVLTGDAGHFKDPAPGRGIGDAFLQADRLAPTIASALNESDKALDDAMSRWGRWRDAEFSEHYWFASDLGAAGPLPTVLLEMSRRLHAQDKASLVLEINNHRLKPSQLLTPARLLGATGQALAHGGGRRLEILRELGGLLARELHRRRLMWRPEYAPGEGTDAGAGPKATEDSEVVRAPAAELVKGGSP
jgi:flavin-dependent dehydrogenase